MTHHATPSRREFLSGLTGVTSVIAVGAAFGGLVRNERIVASDLPSTVGGAASAAEPAVRTEVIAPTTESPNTTDPTDTTSSTPDTTVPIGTGEIALPADPLDGGLVCLNNFNGFSNSNGPCGHNGVDIGENGPFTVARPLVACVDGVIERDEYAGAGGNMRVLRGDDGRWYRYHHLSEYEEGVDPDDRVVRGQTIGYMGKTGNTQWTHLHFEVWVGASNPRDGTAIDPVPLIAFPDSVQVDASRACDV